MEKPAASDEPSASELLAELTDEEREELTKRVHKRRAMRRLGGRLPRPPFNVEDFKNAAAAVLGSIVGDTLYNAFAKSTGRAPRKK